MTTVELRALLAKATPGPWTNLSMTGEPIESVWTDKEAVALWDIGKPSFAVYGEDARHDAALIAAAVNVLPALLDVLDAIEIEDGEPVAVKWSALRGALARLNGTT